MEASIGNSEFLEAPMCCLSKLASLDKRINAHLHKVVNPILHGGGGQIDPPWLIIIC